MKAEIVLWRHGGDWAKVYIDGKLERATHESDFAVEYWLDIFKRVNGNVTIRYDEADEDERR